MLVINPQNNNVKYIWDTLLYLGIGVSFFIIPFTLAFDTPLTQATILDRTRMWEFLFDVAFAIHILLTFFTAYQQDIEWIYSRKLITKAYLKSFFVFDVVATLPGLVTFESWLTYIFKIARFVHFRRLLRQINDSLSKIFNKIGLSK